VSEMYRLSVGFALNCFLGNSLDGFNIKLIYCSFYASNCNWMDFASEITLGGRPASEATCIPYDLSTTPSCTL
jgi:hypothetical protein